ncbi:MAG: hypothetical protein FWG05_01870, partial [Kiritimatiellaeota bacterium]|nr:hypothetical protein [Kiritimatiellota bacterium]
MTKSTLTAAAFAAAILIAPTISRATVNLKVEPERTAVHAGRSQNLAVKISLAGAQPERAE